MTGGTRCCLRDANLGRPPRSADPLTAFSEEPLDVGVEAAMEDFCKTEGAVGDGDGALSAVSG